MLILFGDKIRSQTKPFLYLFQLVGAKDPVHEGLLLCITLAGFFSSSGKVIALSSQMLRPTQRNSLGDVCLSACRKTLKARGLTAMNQRKIEMDK